MQTSNPLIVQSDMTLLLETDHPQSEACRDQILPFAELLKSPEYVHSYKITRLSLWNASTTGYTAERILDILWSFSRYPIPLQVQNFVVEETQKYGKLVLAKVENRLILTGDPVLLHEIRLLPSVKQLTVSFSTQAIELPPQLRGEVKRILAKAGYPVKDLVGYADGEHLPIRLRTVSASYQPFRLRYYQQAAVQSFLTGDADGGSGIVVLPCGSGKTIVGIAAMAALQTYTLILTSNVLAVHQWKNEILDKCELPPEAVGEYTSQQKQIKPITITTYQMLTYTKNGQFPHFQALNQQPWGLILYDEVHLLPAPVFRVTADLQSTRRLGLTATLVREDGAETEVFSLIGPKKYNVPWKQLEAKGWIAETVCYEVWVPFEPLARNRYLQSTDRQKYRIAAENSNKVKVIQALLRLHKQDQVLIIGQYLDQLRQVAKSIQTPLISGQTPVQKRAELFAKFRSGEVTVLVVSKVANLALNLPDANVMIQISGSFGSRQEEAQRLGRLLRPNPNQEKSVFYTVVTEDSYEQEKAMHRQLFLVEQGYEYSLLRSEEILRQEGLI